MTHNYLYLVLLLYLDLNWRWLLSQAIILKIPEKANMENWIYFFQGGAMGEIQLVSNWSHLLQHLEGSHTPVLALLWKLQPKVLGAQKDHLSYSILNTSVVSVFLALLNLLGMHQVLVHQLLYFWHLLDLLNASSTTLNPIQHIHRHLNWSPIYYMCWR